MNGSTIQDTLNSENKLAFLFPGVGSQYSGMGKYVFDQFLCAREVFARASDCANQDVARLCFSPEESDRLGELANAQLAVITTSLASSSVLINEFGIVPDYCAGHSAGEYTALCCSDVLSLEDTVGLILKRAEIVASVVSEVGGTMAWAINLDCGIVEDIVSSLRDGGHQVYISAYDCPDQTSVSVGASAFQPCASAVEEAGGILIPISPSGPYHSPLMEKARAQFSEVLKQYDYRQPLYDVFSNQSAVLYSGDRNATLDNLAEHLVKPVRWCATVQRLLEHGVRYAIELGPKNVLGFLLGKTTKTIRSVSLDKDKDWAAFRSDWLVCETDVIQTIRRCLGLIASTKNECRDLQVYQQDVLEPSTELTLLMHDLRAGNAPLSEANLHRAINTTGSILAAKRLPESEIASRFAEILGPKLLHLRLNAWS